ncbi:hypothetical protein Tco_1201827 [Tanacetum coccineum]
MIHGDGDNDTNDGDDDERVGNNKVIERRGVVRIEMEGASRFLYSKETLEAKDCHRFDLKGRELRGGKEINPLPPQDIIRKDLKAKEFLASQGLDQAFFESINKDPFSGPQWVNLFQINENVYRELVHEFLASFEFDASPYRYDPNHLGVRFRLRGEQREISLLELGWRPTIGDGGFNIGNTKVTAIRDPKVKLAHRCIATTIAGRKESTHRVTEINLFYLYCIYSEGVVFNIPYWLAKYMNGIREKSLICGGMFVTRIA